MKSWRRSARPRRRKVIAKGSLAMNSKTTLPLLDAAAHDEVVDVLRRLTVAYPNNTSNEVACCVARCALEHAGVRAEAIDEFMAAVPKCSKPNGDKQEREPTQPQS